MGHGEFTIGFSNQCERNYSLDRPRWEVLYLEPETTQVALDEITDCLSKGIIAKGIKCPTLRFSSSPLVFCSFPFRRLPLRRNRPQHYALGPVFKCSGRLKGK